MVDDSRFVTCRVASEGRLIVFVHTDKAPSDDEWDGVIERFAASGEMNDARVLVYTAGGAPDVGQRGKLNDLLAGRQPRIAVLTPSRIARAAGVALRWFNPRIRVFEAEALDGALAHLEVDEAEQTYLRTTVASLRADLAGAR